MATGAWQGRLTIDRGGARDAMMRAGAWIAAGASDERPVDAILIGLGGMNLVLAVFNMIPLFPMDGGRVFRALVWLVTGNYYRATSVAGWTGRVLAWGLMGAACMR